MKHQFSDISNAEIPRSSFDRSHGFKTTFDAGWLVPIYVDEALPGDTYNLRMTAFGRLATPLHPFMDNMMVNYFFFAVPMRLLWTNWEKFNGAQDDPGDSTDFTIPQMVAPAGGHLAGSLSDYFGIPTEIATLTHSSMWHRAYNLIYNDWFRDQNLQDSIVVDVDDGPDVDTDYPLRRRGKRHDYFTSALPWPQKGTAVELPLSGNAPIHGIGVPATAAVDLSASYIDEDGAMGMGWKGSVTGIGVEGTGTPGSGGVFNMYADLSEATAATINQLREAFQIQKLYERDARGGTRYIEIIRSHFGVSSPDARLQRPEYLGGGQAPININPVAQTSEAGTTPQGNLSAFGTSVGQGIGFTKSFTEHCILVGMASVRADLTYQQGLHRMFSRSTRWDFYWPALSHIGEQSILNKEIFADASANDELVFGYQGRFDEYRYFPSKVTGQFRSNHSTPLDTWHVSQDFAALPLLNDTFIQDDPPIDRVIAVPSEPHLLLDCYFNLRCARPMPTYAVPGMIDHF